MRNVAMTLPEAVQRFVEPGMHLHFASTPSRSNAAVLEVARAFRGRDPRFVLATSGFHSTAHVLGLLGLGRRYVACFFGDNHPVPRPNPLWSRLLAGGADIEAWGLGSYVAALRAGALGEAWGVTRGLAGSDLGRDLARRGLFAEVPGPAGGAPLGLVRAMRPDVTFIHAVYGDSAGNAVFSAPFGEGFWSARAARCGVVVTVEKRLPPGACDSFRDAIRIPPERVLAVCEAPGGTHPQPLHVEERFGASGLDDDEVHYAAWRRMAADLLGFEHFERGVLSGGAGWEDYRAFVGEGAFEALRRGRREEREHTESPFPQGDPSAAESLTIVAARTIAARVRARGHRSILAGIGQAFLAARLAGQQLSAEGHDVEVLVETGLEGIDCSAGSDGFPLSLRTIANARRLSSVEDVLCARVCGADNRCLGVIGAAEVDGQGDVNSLFSRGTLLVGPGGANDIASAADEVVVVAPARPGRLVARVEHVTSPGRAVVAIATDRGALVRHPGGWRIAHVPVAEEKASAWTEALRQACPWTLAATPAEVDGVPTEDERRRLRALDPLGFQGKRD